MDTEPENKAIDTVPRMLLLFWIGLFLALSSLLLSQHAAETNGLGKGWSSSSNVIFTYPFIFLCFYTFFISLRLLYSARLHVHWLAVLFLLPAIIVVSLIGAMLDLGSTEEYVLYLYIVVLIVANLDLLSSTVKAWLLFAVVTLGMILIVAAHACPSWWRYGHHTDITGAGSEIIDYHCKCGEEKTGTSRYYDRTYHQLVRLKKEDKIIPGDTTFWELNSYAHTARLEKDTMINGREAIISYKTQFYPGGHAMIKTRYTTDMYEETMYTRTGAVHIFSITEYGNSRSYLYDTITSQVIDSAMGRVPYDKWLK